MTKTTSSHHTASLPTGTCLWPVNTCCSSLSTAFVASSTSLKMIFLILLSEQSSYWLFIHLWTSCALGFHRNMASYSPLNMLCFEFQPKYGFLFTSGHSVPWAPIATWFCIHPWAPNSTPSRLPAWIPFLLALLDAQSALNLNQFHQCHYSIPMSWNKSGISLQDKLCYDLLPCITSNVLWKQPIEHFIWARLTNL